MSNKKKKKKKKKSKKTIDCKARTKSHAPLEWVAVDYDESFFDECKSGSEPRRKYDDMKSAIISNAKEWYDFVKSSGACPLSKDHRSKSETACRKMGVKNPYTFMRVNLNSNYRISLSPDPNNGVLYTHVFNSGDYSHKDPGSHGQPGYWRVILNFRIKVERNHKVNRRP